MATNPDNSPAEEWRDVPGYEGVYQASDMGNVRALDRRGRDGRRLSRRALKGWTNHLGYQFVCLPYDGYESRYKSFPIHRLVMAAFVGPKPPGMHTCHNNGNPSDNRLANLRYDTPKGNEADKIAHGTVRETKGEDCSYAKISEVQAREILALNGKMSQYAIAQRYGISRSQVAKILYGIRWPHLGGVRKVERVYMRGEAHKAAHANANAARRQQGRGGDGGNRHKPR